MNELIKIYSHPRSGTHFLEAFLAKNLYSDQDLSSDGAIYYGHWSEKILLESGEPYHKLFGSHFFPYDCAKASKMIYIYRDGRAVIASVWNSNFYQKKWRGISFSEFLRKDIDWYGGLGNQSDPKMNIVEHWYKHVDTWANYKDKNLLLIRFEDLKNDPFKMYKAIVRKYDKPRFVLANLFGNKNLDPIDKKVGLSPNAANIDGWKSLFSQDDLEFFNSQIPSKKYLYNED